jgi:hypothetical protein
MSGPLNEKAKRFTAVEVETLGLWLKADKAGLEDAERVLSDGLQVEHHLSLLDPDETKWTPEQAGDQAVNEATYAATKQEFFGAVTALDQIAKDSSPEQGSGQGGGTAGSGKGGY